LYYFAVPLAHHDHKVCCNSLLHKPEAPPPVQGILHGLASGTIGVRVRCVYTGLWVDDHEGCLGMEDIRRKNRFFLIFGGSKGTEKDDRSEREELAKRHRGPPASCQVYTSLHTLTRSSS
jgi:hypothetical protein